jgi:AraC-like DNA-binding protein
MVTPDFEFFHYRDESTMEIEYHNHDFYEIYFFISGAVTYMIEGKSYKLQPGDVLLINNKELHKPVIEPGEAYERFVIWVNPEFLMKHSTEECDLTRCFETSSGGRHNILRPSAEVHDTILRTLTRFERACNIQLLGNTILKNIYLIELVVFLNRALKEPSGKEMEIDIEYSEKVSSVIRYINDNLGSSLTLDFLASKFYLSKYHLLREFKRHVGYSIHQYIQRKRLILAKSLLKEGLQVTEVSARCGFGDYSNFIRSFKQAYGLSPKKYGKMGL